MKTLADFDVAASPAIAAIFNARRHFDLAVQYGPGNIGNRAEMHDTRKALGRAVEDLEKLRDSLPLP